MLKRDNRITTPEEFRNTRRGARRTATSHLLIFVKTTDLTLPTRVGFIVPNTVGKAVLRNTVKRRLRAIAAQVVRDNPNGLNIVVQALPGAKTATYDNLHADFLRAVNREGR